MKILEISRSYYPSVGGLENFISGRLKIYKALGIEYQLLSTDYSEKKLSYSPQEDNAIFLHRVTPYDFTFGLKKYIDGDYDILSVNQVGRYFSDFAILQASLARKKIILTPHLHYHTTRFSILKHLHSTRILPKVLLKVNKIICFTEFEKKYWMSNYGLPANKIVIIPHYISIQESENDYTKPLFGKYFLYLGRYAQNKRVDLLIKAFNNMLNSDYKLVLTIELNDIDSKLRRVVMANKNIHLTGYIDNNEKESLLKYCEVLILPSDYEAFGGVLLEASKYHKPILVSNLPILKEVLNSNDFIYFENNVNSILERLKYFISLSEIDKEKLARNNFDNLSRFQFNDICNKYKDLLFGLLNAN